MARTQETLFTGGRFVDPSVGCEPIAEALLSRDGKIAYLGDEATARTQAGPDAEVIVLAGRTAVPGWVDCHVHLKGVGTMMGLCDLSGTADKKEALDRLAEFAAARPGEQWIRGRGYNLNAWADPSYPLAADLDTAVPDRPCVVRSFDGHSCWVNSTAMKLLGINRDTPDPEGGRIVRDEAGDPTGMLLESAAWKFLLPIRTDTPQKMDEDLRAGVEHMVRLGYTGAHWPDLGGESEPVSVLARFERLWPANSCPLRVRVFAPFDCLEQAAELSRGAGRGDRVQIAGIKSFYDGSLGVRTAWMFDPYIGGDDCGMRVMEPGQLRLQIERANGAGLPLICHAIGDRACHEVLQAFVEAGDPKVGNRIEHAQIVRQEDIERFARAGVAASVQPAHLWTDWQPSDKLLGPERAATSFVFRSILDAGVTLAVGSDAPVVPADPRHSLHAAVTRTDGQGRPAGGWHIDQAISPSQWVRAASADAWRSIGQADPAGRLAVGADCDLTIVREDFLAESFTDYLGLHVDAVVVGGRVTFSALPRQSVD